MDETRKAEDVPALGDARAAQVVEADRARPHDVVGVRVAVDEPHSVPRDGSVDAPEGSVLLTLSVSLVVLPSEISSPLRSASREEALPRDDERVLRRGNQRELMGHRRA